ncbi:MAG: DUF1330 domain-containing protein [Deltaproteobacteria bacterium]|nr:DUF1330 domain-containing protein [Deltaproteobacteria bacterium]
MRTERLAVSVYMVAEIEIRDHDLYSKYVERVAEVVEQHGGRYLVRGGRVTPLSGNWDPERMILIEFETVEQLRRCFRSAEYLELAPLREQSTVSKSIIVESYSPSE